MLFTNRTYTKNQDIYDQESLRNSGFLYSALQSPLQYIVVTAIKRVVRLSPKGEHLFPSVFQMLNPVGRG